MTRKFWENITTQSSVRRHSLTAQNTYDSHIHTLTAYALIARSAVAGVPVAHRQLTRHQFVTPSSRHSHTPPLRPRNLRAFGLIHNIITALAHAITTPSKSTRFRAHSHHHHTLSRALTYKIHHDLSAIHTGTALATIALMASTQLSFPYPAPSIYFCLIWLHMRPTLKTVIRNTVHTSTQAHHGLCIQGTEEKLTSTRPLHRGTPERDARRLTFEPFVWAQLTLPSPSWPLHS